MNTRRTIALVLITFLISAVVATTLIWRLEQYRLKVYRSELSDTAGNNAHNLQVSIERALSATHALAALVRQGKGTIPDFDVIGRQMLDLYPGVSNLQLSPNGIVTQVVPLQGNEKVIGLDQLKDPVRTKEAFIAKDTGKLTIAGPFDILQGGLGAVGRLPVFLADPKLESLGVLAGGIAHDFNNILTVIMGHCYMAREDMIPEQEYKAAFQKMETAGNRAKDLCRQMLSYAGKSPMEQTLVSKPYSFEK